MAHFELIEKMAPNAVIKVVGVGGGGGNAVAHMVNTNVDGVEFITANTVPVPAPLRWSRSWPRRWAS